MWRAMYRSGVLGRCPACGGDRMFRGPFALHERCGACGVRYETADGAWLGAIAIGYAFGAASAVLLAVAEAWWGPIRALGLHPGWTIAAASLVVTLITYRPAKGIWFGLLYHFGFMQEPGTP